jgi:hypothetical protein
MNERRRTGPTVFRRRYADFRDASGSWTFEIREYRNDIESIVPIEVPRNPSPQEAYRTAVFLEGFIQEQKRTGDWTDAALAEFGSFESTAEVEAVARALRETGGRTDQ